MLEKSMVDVAYDVIKANNGPVPFATIWNEVVKTLGLSEKEVEDKISLFYTSLSLDGRFHNMGDNTWDLCSNLTFEQVNADIDFSLQETYDKNEEDSDEEIEDEENDEYEDEDIDDIDYDEDEDEEDIDEEIEEEDL